MRPYVGLRPTTPLYAAGRRIEPPVCVPSAMGTSRAATAAPDPLLDPPGVRSARHGLRVGDGSPEANCVVTVLPTRTAPAAFMRATAKESAFATLLASGGYPAVVGSPSAS